MLDTFPGTSTQTTIYHDYHVSKLHCAMSNLHDLSQIQKMTDRQTNEHILKFKCLNHYKQIRRMSNKKTNP